MHIGIHSALCAVAVVFFALVAFPGQGIWELSESELLAVGLAFFAAGHVSLVVERRA